VKRQLYRGSLFIVLTVCFICPMVEMFDHWHDAIQTGSDTEYAVVVLALCIPVAVSFSRIVRRTMSGVVRAVTASLTPQKSRCYGSEFKLSFVLLSATSPPIFSLRI
jgi:hypothetical protein